MRRVTIALLSLLAFAAPAAAQQRESPGPRPWKFTMLTGVGVREIDSEGYGAPLVGFSGSRPRGERIELGVEAFVLLPSELVVAPSPMFIPNDGGLGGATQMSVNNIDVVVLVRMNYWLAPWKVRPYLGIGVGGHVFKSSRVGTRTIHELPDDQPRTITRETQDGGFFCRPSLLSEWTFR